MGEENQSLKPGRRLNIGLLIVLGLILVASVGVTYKTLALNKPSLKPGEVAHKFLEAVQRSDKGEAKKYLSANANKEAFRATLEEAAEVPSLYEMDFTFSIKEVQVSEDAKKAVLAIELMVGASTIEGTIELIKEGGWLGGYRWYITNMYFYEERPYKRAVLYLKGPASLYLTDPYGKHVGLDPARGEEVNEVEGAFYNRQTIYGLEQVTIQDMDGTWNVKVVGTGSGKYKLVSEIVDRENHQIKTVEGTINQGETIEYEVSYPAVTGIPIEFKLVE